MGDGNKFNRWWSPRNSDEGNEQNRLAMESLEASTRLRKTHDQWSAGLPKMTWDEWRSLEAQQSQAAAQPSAKAADLPTDDRDQIIVGTAEPMVPPSEDFSGWTTDALAREIWDEVGTAFMGGVLGIPIAVVGLFMAVVSSVPWRGDSIAGCVAGAFLCLIGGTIMWLFQRRWSALRNELARRNAAARRERGMIRQGGAG